MRRISVNVGGLWRTSVELKEEATWHDLKNEIGKVTGIMIFGQKLEPCGKYDKKCELEEGEDVYCDWELSDGDHPLHHAAKNGNKEAIHSWLASGADINVTNKYKTTPLMYACMKLKGECVSELLHLGACINDVDIFNETSFHYLSNNSSLHFNLEMAEKIIKILLRMGCDPTIRNKRDMTFVDILKKKYVLNLALKCEKWIKNTPWNHKKK